MNINKFIKHTFRDKLKNPSGREVTVFVFSLSAIASWIGEQFFGKHVPEYMFVSFISLITAGIGLYTFEKPKESEKPKEKE